MALLTQLMVNCHVRDDSVTENLWLPVSTSDVMKLKLIAYSVGEYLCPVRLMLADTFSGPSGY